jgi:hypothetical protein
LPTETGDEIEVFDPVNPANNVASGYGLSHRERIVSAALAAHEALADAYYAPTKERAVDDWKQILGPSFSG